MQVRVRFFLAIGLLVSAAQAAEQPRFLRFVEEPGGGKLEASVVTYRNAAGQTVDLIAAVHIADAAFFHELDGSFKEYDSLLYEMVKPKSATAPARHPRPMMWVGLLQRFLKEQLQLAFQLEEINYNAANFVHADLDMETFQRMQADRGESMLQLILQQMIHEMARSTPGAGGPDLAELLVALQSPDRARQLKLVLGRQFGEMDDMLAGMEGPNGSVLLTERNKAAIRVLKQRLAAGDRKIGIFYGAAHLKGMEKILTGEMGFEQVGEPKWRTAWDMSPAPATTQTTRP